MRFRQQYNELIYAVQNEQSNPTSRRLALQIEEKSAINRYIMNLRDEIGAQIHLLRPDTLNIAQREALEAEVWYIEKNHNKSLSLKTTHSKAPVKPNFSQPKSVFQHGMTIPKYPSIFLQPITRHRNTDFKHSAKTVSDLDIMKLNVTRREIFLLVILQLVHQTEFSACRKRTTLWKTS